MYLNPFRISTFRLMLCHPFWMFYELRIPFVELHNHHRQRFIDRTVCLRPFSILSPEMYPKACSRQNEKIKLHRPSLFSLRSGSAKEAENADGMTSENASHKNSGAPESLSLFLLPPYHSSGAFGTMKPPHTVPLYQTHRML